MSDDTKTKELEKKINDLKSELEKEIESLKSKMVEILKLTEDIGKLRLPVDSATNSLIKNSVKEFLNSNNIFMRNLKSGANQGASGAQEGELWVDTDDANTIKQGS